MSNLEKNLFELHKNIIRLARSERRERAIEKAFEPEENKYSGEPAESDMFDHEEE